MKQLYTFLIILFTTVQLFAQQASVNHNEVKEDLDELLKDLSESYVYLLDKKVDLNCIRNYYSQQIPTLKNSYETVQFFEYLLNEFYDSHLILNTNTSSSYRLFAPVYATLHEGKLYISHVWLTQLSSPLNTKIPGAEIKSINGMDFDKAIESFPTHCHDKTDPVIREWIANKLLAGRRDQPRVLGLKTVEGSPIELDLDQLVFKQETDLLSSHVKDGYGIIRINNSLGNNQLIPAFDMALDSLMDTEGLILDLRNTVDGGNSYVARGIMGRFVQEPKAYQKHLFQEHYLEGTPVERSWVEYVSPRKQRYTKPVVVLVGRWTGSMGEGLAIGMEAVGAAQVAGSEMERLAGEMNGFSFRHQSFGYRLSTARLYHVNGTPREAYVPAHYVKQTSTTVDETLAYGLELLLPPPTDTDSILRRKLEQLGVEDQTLRLMLADAREKFGRDSDELRYIWKLIHHQDSICIEELTQLIDTHGWLGKSRVGIQANQYIWLIVQHADLEIQKKYLPLLRASVAQDESQGWHLAYLEDRVLMYQEKKQIYGTQAVWNPTLKKNVIYPIEDVQHVNKRRKELGMEPIEDYARKSGYLFQQEK